ncbi:hypothetical protein FA15DRAFT_665790 [Coprinopsis marcescibilis]|uniref:HTH CENPB-type domain-containing protein n=1 Tax=Coprinopsis marcescibilis TaxID=230819 RepID=A0A5C3L5X0_COPMA|nr:hypothetical protein FA15DRAFT_665790 [Coprinopsis marcescibilis]
MQLSLDTPDSRPATPSDDRPQFTSPSLSLTINADLALAQPDTPASLCSPYLPYTSYHSFIPDARPPSPAPSSRSYPNSPSALAFQSRSSKKHTKKKLDALEKKKICLYHQHHQNARQEDIAEQFGIERSTVSKILKAKQHWLAVGDRCEGMAKQRPSKFPELEAEMRIFLQICVDKDVAITDALIRTRALQAAKALGIGEEKFKASSGWIENFKHRHAIKSGKWTTAVKSCTAATFNPNPGLNGTSYLPTSFNLHHPPQTASNDRYPSPDSDTSSDDQAAPPAPSISDPARADYPGRLSLMPSSLSASSSSDSVNAMQTEGTAYIPQDPLVYTGRSEHPPVPTLQEAESAIDTVIYFVNACGHELLEPNEREALTSIKCALFQFASGLPFDRYRRP